MTMFYLTAQVRSRFSRITLHYGTFSASSKKWDIEYVSFYSILGLITIYMELTITLVNRNTPN